MAGAPTHPGVASGGSLPLAVDRTTTGHQAARAGPAPGATLPCPPRGACLDEGLGPLAASYRRAQRRRSLGREPALAGIGMLGDPDSPSGEGLPAPGRPRRARAALA